MKKFIVFGAAILAAMVMTGCKSKESAYRKAYEKARAQEQEQVQAQPQTPVVTPLVEQPATQKINDNVDNEAVRQEKLTVVNGSGLKAFSVVVGAYGVKANAERELSNLKNAGYPAQLAYNSERNMYRVVISTFDSKVDAVALRNQVRSKYPDAWLLMSR